MKKFEEDIEQSLAVLKNGGIILYPTDTIWGLGCDATNAEAVEKIYLIKKRAASKSMIILAADISMIRDYVANPSEQLLAIIERATEPTTVIFSNAKNLPANLVNEDGSIAIRKPADAFCNKLISAFKKPIVSTSANLSGTPPPQNFSEINDLIIQQADYVVHHRRDDQTKKNPSHIVRLNEQNEVERIR